VGLVKALEFPVVDKNNSYLVKTILSTYLGESCKYCGKLYATLKDLDNTVWAGVHAHGRLACQACWSANNKNVQTI
jgi:hypothetical protein